MSPEMTISSQNIITESMRIKDELLFVQSEVQAVASAKQAELLEGVRSRLGYLESQPVDLDDLQDIRIQGKSIVITPEALSTVLPVSKQAAETTRKSRLAVEDILRQKDGRLNVIVGPCSLHDPVAAIEYAKQIKAWREEFGDDLEIIMRGYFEKPRTEKGWKGLTYDPLLDGSDDINLGVVLTRMLSCQITEMGVPLATERLNANTPQFLNSLITYDAIGARNAADQKSREYASGTSSPVGMKNSPEGSIEVAAQAVVAANAPHAFIGMEVNGMMCQEDTTGNDLAHIILRGSDSGPNYSPVNIEETKTYIKDKNILEAIVIDLSHKNKPQETALLSVCEQIALGERAICGVMIESNLQDGAQSLKHPDGTLKMKSELVYGQSITDECVGVIGTHRMLTVLADAVKSRRQLLAA